MEAVMTKTQARKRRTRFQIDAEYLINRDGGADYAVVLTLTTRANLTLNDFHSLRESFFKNKLRPHLGTLGPDSRKRLYGLSVTELQARGAPHEHSLLRTPWPVGTGAKWGKRWSSRRSKYVHVQFRQTKTQALADLQQWVMHEWDHYCRLRTTNPEGNPWAADAKTSSAHCQPIRTCAGAAANYLANYLETGPDRVQALHGRKLCRRYGSVLRKNDHGETFLDSPHPCLGNFSHYARKSSQGYERNFFDTLYRGRVAAFAAEFGCVTLAQLDEHLGSRARFEHGDVIRKMVLPEHFDFPTADSRLYESNLRRSRALTNRAMIEASGLKVVRYAQRVPIVYFRSSDEEQPWSASPVPASASELFPSRLCHVSQGELSLLTGSRSLVRPRRPSPKELKRLVLAQLPPKAPSDDPFY
jgi:hypothetical protein